MPDSAQHGVHVETLDATPELALLRVASAADSWGGEWQADEAENAVERTGKLILPVSAGVRRGWIGFHVAATPTEKTADQTDPNSASTRLELRVAEEHLHVERGTVVVLVTALLGALLFLVVPFVPRLMPLLPVGFVLTVAGWLFVAARLRNSGAEEFLAQVSEAARLD